MIYPSQIDKIIDDFISGRNKYSFTEMEAQTKENSLENHNMLILKGLVEINGEKSLSFFVNAVQ